MKRSLLSLFFILLCSSLSFSQVSFSGVFREVSVPVTYWNNASWDSFIAKHKELRSKGYQLTDFEGKHVKKGKSGRFWGIWMKTKVHSKIISRSGWDEFVKLFEEEAKKGYYLDDIESMLNRNGKRIYIGLFAKGKREQYIHKFKNRSDLFSQAKKYKNKKAFLTDMDPFKTRDAKFQFLAIYSKGADKSTQLVSYDKWESFNSDRRKKRKSGLRMMDYEKYSYKGKKYFMAIYRSYKNGGKSPKESFWSNLVWYSFKAQRNALKKTEGVRLVDIEISTEKGVIHAPDFYSGKFEETEDIWQHMPKIEEYKNSRKFTKKQKKELEFASNSFCGPTAVSNSMMYLIKNGYPKLAHKNSQIEMVKLLGSEDYMDAFGGGTSMLDMTRSVKRYIEEKGYKLEGAYIEHISATSDHNSLKNLDYLTYKPNQESLDVEAFKKRVINPKSICILLWGRYEAEKKEFHRTGGHYVTVVGYGLNTKGDLKNSDATLLSVHDPSTKPTEDKQRVLWVRPFVGHTPDIKEKTKLKNFKKNGKLKWGTTAKGKVLIHSDGVKRYVLEGLIEYRIR